MDLWDFVPRAAVETAGFCAVGLFFLFLGAAANALIRGEDYGTVLPEILGPKSVGNMIIVFITVVLPMVSVFLTSWRENIREPALLLSIVPIFNAGLAVDKLAERATSRAEVMAAPEQAAGVTVEAD